MKGIFQTMLYVIDRGVEPGSIEGVQRIINLPNTNGDESVARHTVQELVVSKSRNDTCTIKPSSVIVYLVIHI